MVNDGLVVWRACVFWSDAKILQYMIILLMTGNIGTFHSFFDTCERVFGKTSRTTSSECDRLCSQLLNSNRNVRHWQCVQLFFLVRQPGSSIFDFTESVVRVHVSQSRQFIKQALGGIIKQLKRYTQPINEVVPRCSEHSYYSLNLERYFALHK